jgi:hypothetical protein
VTVGACCRLPTPAIRRLVSNVNNKATRPVLAGGTGFLRLAYSRSLGARPWSARPPTYRNSRRTRQSGPPPYLLSSKFAKVRHCSRACASMAGAPLARANRRALVGPVLY